MKRSSSTVSSLSRRASVTSLPPWEELPFDLTAVRELYLAKCQDLNLAPSDGREDRFIDFFRRKAAAADVLELRQAGLGARSAAALATFFANDSHFNALDLAVRNTLSQPLPLPYTPFTPHPSQVILCANGFRI